MWSRSCRHPARLGRRDPADQLVGKGLVVGGEGSRAGGERFAALRVAQPLVPRAGGGRVAFELVDELPAATRVDGGGLDVPDGRLQDRLLSPEVGREQLSGTGQDAAGGTVDAEQDDAEQLQVGVRGPGGGEAAGDLA